MDYYRALRLLAMRAVEKPDREANLRSIYRWYSRTFHTPLPQVEDLPIEEVLMTYYESTYEDLGDEERARELESLLETPQEAQEKRRRQDSERAEAYDFAIFTAEEERRKQAAEQRKLSDLKPEEQRKFAKAPETTLPKIPIKDLKEIPPDIEMKFVTNEEFEAELDRPALGGSKKPQSST